MDRVNRTVVPWVMVASLLGWGCASGRKPIRVVDAIQAQTEVPEEQLLDVGIQPFTPGLPPGVTDAELQEEGIFSEIRKSESRYFAVQLKRTLQGTGNWGAVRVVPKGNTTLDLTVTGNIVRSNGKDIHVDVLAVDATGRTWLRHRYEQRADPAAFKEGADPAADPHQNLYNRIANDLLKTRNKRDDTQLASVRKTADLRFAADIAPDAFADYLVQDSRGQYQLARLPADDDPMLQRVAAIRERDHMLVDTLNEYYSDFHGRMDSSYRNWREYSYEEQLAYDELKRQSTLNKILGGVAIASAILVDDNSRAGRASRDAAILIGVSTISAGMRKAEEAKIHRAALRELATSFDAEMAPVVIDVEDRTVELSGSAETQYATWRDLLRSIFAAETGLPVDPNAGAPINPESLAATAE